LSRSTRDLLNTLHMLGERSIEIQIAGRLMGRYHDAARPAVGHNACRHCRVSNTGDALISDRHRRRLRLVREHVAHGLGSYTRGWTMSIVHSSYDHP
jgi:hypothetical protein